VKKCPAAITGSGQAGGCVTTLPWPVASFVVCQRRQPAPLAAHRISGAITLSPVRFRRPGYDARPRVREGGRARISAAGIGRTCVHLRWVPGRRRLTGIPSAPASLSVPLSAVLIRPTVRRRAHRRSCTTSAGSRHWWTPRCKATPSPCLPLDRRARAKRIGTPSNNTVQGRCMYARCA
jgi:hypothetical protein